MNGVQVGGVEGECIDAPGSAWRPGPLVASQLGAVLLYGSWLLPAGRVLWDELDAAVFFFLNGTLAAGGGWSLFWALANNRLFDLVPASFMILLFGAFLLAGGRRHLARRSAIGLFMVLYSMVATRLLKVVFYDFNRWSPTQVFEESIRLSRLYPDIPLKDASSSSFPGDHTTVLLLFAAFLWHHAGPRRGLAAWGLALVFSLPRLVGGGHWLTDEVVGGGSLFLAVIGWALYTPLQQESVAWLAPRLPLVGAGKEPPPAVSSPLS